MLNCHLLFFLRKDNDFYEFKLLEIQKNYFYVTM